MRQKPYRLIPFVIFGLAAGATADARSAGDGRQDFGVLRDQALADRAGDLFGFEGTVASSTASVDAATANADPTSLITVARGLHVRVVSASAATPANTDQMALWPDDFHPTHIITINEQGTAEPGVVRIRLSDGAVETILTGTSSGDPIRRTPWGTILAGEEAGTTGQFIEILNPLATTNVVYDRVMGTAINGPGGSGAENVTPRWALGRISFEGIALMPNGVAYYGDELGPSNGTHGGAYYKFIPAVPYLGGGPITSLGQSPLVSGQVYGLRLSRGSNFGQGSETGMGVWVPIPGANNGNLRALGASLGLAGFYRPEDADIDLAELAAGNVRFCGNNTGNENDNNFGNTICITDGTLANALANTATPELQLLVAGNSELAMQDNMAYNPRKGFWVMNEDGEGPGVGRNNDIWACLDDGSDFDLLTDGCLRFATLNDLTAESTGGIFDGTGRHYYVSIQHNVTGHGVVLDITGWGGDGHGHDRR
jgi:secreted PhoX family phosphatase